MTTNYLIARVDSSCIGDYTNSGNFNAVVPNPVSSHLVALRFYTNYEKAAKTRIVQLDSNHVGWLPALTENNANYAALTVQYLAPSFTSWNVTQALPVYEFDLRVVITNAGITSSGTKYFWAQENNFYGCLTFKWSTSGTARTFKIQDVEIPALADGDWVKVRIVFTSATEDNKGVADIYVDGVKIISGYTPSLDMMASRGTFMSFSLSNVSKWSDDPSRVEIANFKVYEQDEYTAPPTVTFSQEQTVGSSLITANVTLDPGIEDPAVSYLWSTGETTQSIRVYANGEYTVTVTDSAGGVTTKTLTLSNLVCLPYPLQSSYSQEHTPSIVRTQMLDKHARQRTLAGTPPSSLSCKFQMDETMFTAWRAAWKEVLNEGADWFYLRALGESNAVIENKQVRLRNGEWSYSLIHHTDTGNLYEVTMKFDVKEV